MEELVDLCETCNKLLDSKGMEGQLGRCIRGGGKHREREKEGREECTKHCIWAQKLKAPLERPCIIIVKLWLAGCAG